MRAGLAAGVILTVSFGALAASGPQHGGAKPGVIFTDVTMQLGINWRHTNGASSEKYLIETMGGGGGFLDYNRDGRLDIFLVQSGCTKASLNCTPGKNALYRQSADGTFTDVAGQAGVAQSGIYGMGIAVGDFDNDGYPDIYVTGFPHNALYHNNRDGTFTDVTQKAGVASAGWSSGAAFFDYNKDGLPDLYVGRYMDWDYSRNPACGANLPARRSYCHPDQFPCISSKLFRNNGDGTFTDVSESAGIAKSCGKALGVVVFDFNRDGWNDLYVTNDTMPNFLFRNMGDGTFKEVALQSEVALGFSGKPQSGMGVDAADFDGDGLPDLFVTNIDFEPNDLFRNEGDETFTDVTVAQSLGSVAYLTSGFGTRFLDYDNAGKLDLVVLNGHVLDDIAQLHQGVSYAERPFLLENTGARFEEVGAQHGEAFKKIYVGRALATGDFNNDGALDMLWVTNGGAPVLLRNDGGNRNSWIGFSLAGTTSGKDAVAAIVTVVAGGKRQVRDVVGGASYMAAHDPRLLFGLGSAASVKSVDVRWPSGASSHLENLDARHYYTIEEPQPAKKP
jgi:hypothetical protein